MFADTKLEILNSADLSILKTIYADVQPYAKSLAFEDRYTLEITHRAFCEKNATLDISRYLRINGHIYIILDLKTWSDHVELHLYRCKSDFS